MKNLTKNNKTKKIPLEKDLITNKVLPVVQVNDKKTSQETLSEEPQIHEVDQQSQITINNKKTLTSNFIDVIWNNIIFLVIGVFLLKIFIAAKTEGTNDITTWRLFSEITQKQTGAGLYTNLDYFNHPPFTVNVVKFVQLLESLTKIDLAFWLRLFSSLSDMGSVLITYKILLKIKGKENLPKTALILMIFAPVSIMVSGFHGNTDPNFIFFLLLSVYLIDVSGDKLRSYLPETIYKYFTRFGLSNLTLAGLFYGLSMNVKIVPMIVAPCIFFYLSNNKRRIEYFLSAAIIWMLLSMPYIVQVPMQIAKHTFGYNSFYGLWGASRIFNTYLSDNLWLNDFYANQGKFLIIALIALFAFLINFVGKKIPLFFQIGFAFSLFLFLSPGFGIQYLTWLVPWIVGLSIELTLLYYLTSGIFAFMIYNSWSSGFPWNRAFAFNHDQFFIIKHEYICWFSIVIITICYIVYIVKLKNLSFDEYFTNLWIKKYAFAITLTILVIISISTYKDLFINNAIHFYYINGETKEIREVNLKEKSFLMLSYFHGQVRLYQEEVEDCKEALKINPNNPDAYNNLCSAYNNLQEWEKAIEAGNNALRLNPNYQLARNNLNFAKSQLAATGKILTSSEDIIGYIKSPPANFTDKDFVNLSLELIQKGDNYSAILVSEKAVEINPNSFIAYNNMCIAYNNIFIYSEAEIACKKALEINPQFELAKNNYDFTLSRKADQNAPKATVANYINLSLAFLNVGNFEKSIYISKKALEIDSNNPIIYNNICVCYNGLSQWEKAIESCEKAIKIDPNFVLAKNNLSWAKSQKSN
ncbi:MAG: hypothetical protein J0M03_01915 [Acidobacteria bacterium]|nr:hypothetical protein [Acidobacteriota bacterium]